MISDASLLFFVFFFFLSCCIRSHIWLHRLYYYWSINKFFFCVIRVCFLLYLYLQGNSSYQFGFDVKDDEYTNYQQRKEVRDGNVIKGSYSVVDSDGFIRTVTYTADPKEGFKADVVRQPTDIVVKIPTPSPDNSIGKLSRPQPHFLPQQSQYRQQAQRQQQPQQQIRQPIQVQPEYE